MKPDDLRAEIPALNKTIYLNTGASGPSPTSVVEARKDAVEVQEYAAPAEEGIYDYAFDLIAETKENIARHIGCDPIEVALTESTGDGIARLTAAMSWSSNDSIVRTDLEHSAGYLPCERLRRQHGVEVRIAQTEKGRIDKEHFKNIVEDARLVVLSSISWTRGTQLNIPQLTAIAHDAGAKVLVDAVQTIGQRKVDVDEWGADAIAASGHKWVLGGWGSGFLYVNSEFAEKLQPAHLSYFSVEFPPSETYELRPGADRLQIGTTALSPYAGLQEALQIIEDIGYKKIESRIERLTSRLKHNVPSAKLNSPSQYESGLVSIDVPDPNRVENQLASHGIQVKYIRPLEAVRASVHVFNNERDIDELVKLIK